MHLFRAVLQDRGESGRGPSLSGQQSAAQLPKPAEPPFAHQPAHGEPDRQSDVARTSGRLPSRGPTGASRG